MGQFPSNGVIYEELPNGRLRVVSHVPQGAADPYKVEDQAMQRASNARAGAAAERANANSAAANANAVAMRDLAERKFAFERQNSLNPAAAKLTAKERSDAIAQYVAAGRIERLLGEAQQNYATGPGATSGIEGIVDYLPTETNQQFDAMGQRFRGDVKKLMAFTGGEGNTMGESTQLYDPFLPSSWDKNAKVEDKFSALKSLAGDARAESISILGGAPDANGRVSPVDIQKEGAVAVPNVGGMERSAKIDISGPGGDGGSALAAPNATSHTENDPVLRGINNHVRQMIDSGKSSSEIEAYINTMRRDVPGKWNNSGIDAAVQWKRQHPGSHYTGQVNVDDRMVPMSGVRQLGNTAAQSAPGTFAIQGLNALTANNLDSFTTDPDQARVGLQGLSEMHPYASGAGQVAGAVLGTLGTGKLLGGAGKAMAAGRAASALASPLTADIAYSAAYGAGDMDENRLKGAFLGGGLGLAGNKLGSALTSGAGKVVSGITNPVLENLNAHGIPMTLGQMSSRGGMFGRVAKGVEDRVSGLPFVGDAIQARRAEGMSAYNKAEFQRGMAPIGADIDYIGPQGVDQAFDATTRAYNAATAGADIPLDQQYGRELGEAMDVGNGLPGGMGDQFGYTMQQRVRPELEGGNITGDAYQAIMRGLKRDKAGFANEPRGYDFSQAIGGVQDATKGLMMRGGGADVVSGLGAADKAYGNAKILQDAVTRARSGSVSGEINTFTPSQMIDAATAAGKKFGGSNGTTRRPFAGLADDAQAVLPSKVPDSGTAGRLLMPGLLGGSLAGADYLNLIDPNTALALGSLALPYTKIGSKALQKGMFGRPAALKKIGKDITKKKAIGAALGTPLALQYLPEQ